MAGAALLVFLGPGLLLTACADNGGLTPINQTAAAEPQYHLDSGDRLRIIVLGQPDLTGEYVVDGSGKLSFPLIGAVEAGGLTPPQLEKRIADKLSPTYLKNPSISAEVLTYRPFYIVGEVKNPGSYPYVNGMSVINAVALAGGFTYRARDDDFVLERDKNSKRVKYLAHPDTQVLPGDVINVRERYF